MIRRERRWHPAVVGAAELATLIFVLAATFAVLYVGSSPVR